MKLIRNIHPHQSLIKNTLLLVVIFSAHTFVCAQTPAPSPAASRALEPSPAIVSEGSQTQPAVPTQSAESAAVAAETDTAVRRLARARALAAIGKLAASASELETLRASSKDESVRDVARILLMAILVEMPDYTRASALLGEAYKARTLGQTSDAATHAYFALAGQTINAIRTHLERYRSFGVNVSDTAELPSEANGDLEQLRGLLERVVDQAKTLREEQVKGDENGGRGLDAAALLEDAATVRMRLARHEQDRGVWQAEVSEARQHLFSSEMRIASISNIPNARPEPVATQTATLSPKSASANAGADNKAAKKSSQSSTGQSQPSPANTATQSPSTVQQPGAAAQPPPTPPATGASPDAAAPVSVGSLTNKAKQRVSPTYPATARAARVSGIVTVYLLVNEKGEVESVQRADGPPQLQQAASDAARRWRFNPTVIDGQPARVTGFLSFNFTAQN